MVAHATYSFLGQLTFSIEIVQIGADCVYAQRSIVHVDAAAMRKEAAGTL